MATKAQMQKQLEIMEFRQKFNTEKRTKTISLRISEDTYSHLRIKANSHNQSVSDYINNLILEEWVQQVEENYNEQVAEIQSQDLFKDL